MVVFNLEVTHAARFALKTTSAFNEEPKREISVKDQYFFWGVEKLYFSAKTAKF